MKLPDALVKKTASKAAGKGMKGKGKAPLPFGTAARAMMGASKGGQGATLPRPMNLGGIKGC